MRKFNKPFDEWSLTSDYPMSIELSPYSVARYRELSDNPIYYLNAIQYVNGGLFRAALGYEVLWDRKLEERMELALDYFLTRLNDQRDYYLEEIVFSKGITIHGLPWKRRVKPKFNFSSKWPREVKRGERALARVNRLDGRYHVDLDFDQSGDVITITYMDYERLKRGHVKSLEKPRNEKRNTRAGRAGSQNGKSRAIQDGQVFSIKDATERLPANVFDLRQRLRRKTSL